MTTILAVSCAQSGVPIDLQIVNWDPTQPAIRQAYRCPACGDRHTVEVPGQIVLVVRRIVTRVPVAR
jgi:hypothetical protein